jgi:hypothetical protein
MKPLCVAANPRVTGAPDLPNNSAKELSNEFISLYQRLIALPTRSNCCDQTRETYNQLRSLARTPCSREKSRMVLSNLQQVGILEKLRSLYQEVQFNSELERIPV